MKKGLIVFALAFALLTACDDSEDDNKNNLNSRVAEVENTAVQSQWRGTYYFHNELEQTGNFQGYIFEFDGNNTMTATNGSNNFMGTWSLAQDDRDDDAIGNEFSAIDFNINFTNPQSFEELTEDWQIISVSADKIELQQS